MILMILILIPMGILNDLIHDGKYALFPTPIFIHNSLVFFPHSPTYTLSRLL